MCGSGAYNTTDSGRARLLRALRIGHLHHPRHVPPIPQRCHLAPRATLADPPKLPDAMRQAAVHEAGHIVLMQWVGLLPPEATIAATDDGRVTGEAQWPAPETFAQLPDPGPDESGVLAATAAAVFHAGLAAELIESGAPWAGPIHYADATDYQRADEMLRPSFGFHASGAHGYAQQVALHVLHARWADVEAVASELLRCGRWRA